ncbi:hypothetical protein [uncultured Amphritea sp.]|uniref:hypothetical protein n=1 Tax=uncultured Amphritea sp. TaxID=981605 RepID=UPI0026029566|nr:hypothetical protein [uncultured Amphritea sp.]
MTTIPELIAQKKALELKVRELEKEVAFLSERLETERSRRSDYGNMRKKDDEVLSDMLARSAFRK